MGSGVQSWQCVGGLKKKKRSPQKSVSSCASWCEINMTAKVTRPIIWYAGSAAVWRLWEHTTGSFICTTNDTYVASDLPSGLGECFVAAFFLNSTASVYSVQLLSVRALLKDKQKGLCRSSFSLQNINTAACYEAQMDVWCWSSSQNLKQNTTVVQFQNFIVASNWSACHVSEKRRHDPVCLRTQNQISRLLIGDTGGKMTRQTNPRFVKNMIWSVTNNI